MHLNLLAVLSLFLTAFATENNENENIIIEVDGIGKIKGSILETVKEKKFLAFRGIPYAESPIGKLRFKPPFPKTAWIDSEPFDATKDGPECFQFEILSREITGDEDCLSLNVYTESVDLESPKRAVMVYIHGGAFSAGSGASFMYGPRRILDHDIVFVTINYRLHSLGFLSTGDDASPGNYGLLDQREALKWVNKNIHAFGGDPEKVTIFGESAGGASVFYHILSPLSTGLFHRAISMSGNSLCPWAFTNNPLSWAKKIARKVGCQVVTSNALVECLRETPVKKLTHPMVKYSDELISPFPPVFDDYFLPDTPFSLIQKGQIANRVPIMLGTTKNEGLFYFAALFGNELVDFGDKTLGMILSHSLNVPRNAGVVPKLVKALGEHYLLDEVEMENAEQHVIREKLIDIMSDGPFVSPHYQTVLGLLDAGIEPYVYSYDYDSGHSFAEFFGLKNMTGIGHAEDLYFLFDSERIFPEYTKTDDVEASKFLQLWVNFAKFGNPTPTSDKSGDDFTPWLPAKKGNILRYHLGVPITTDVYNPEDDSHRSFWLQKIPAILAGPKKIKKDEL